jgi:arginine decarboxylase
MLPKGSAKSWYVIDGSFMNDLLDTWAIHQKWHVVPVNNADETLKSVWLAGSSCDSDDKYTGGNYILAPKLRDNQRQYLCFLDSGAYQDALASHHCLLSSPAKLIAESGTIKIARKRETPDMVGRFFGWDNSTT